MVLSFTNDIQQVLRKNRHIQLDKLHKHWYILQKLSDRTSVWPLPELDPLPVRQKREKARGVLKRPVLPPSLAENRATETNIAPLLIGN